MEEDEGSKFEEAKGYLFATRSFEGVESEREIRGR
jgi:hypothetical protein